MSQPVDSRLRSLCLVLAGRHDLVDWPTSSADWDLLIATARAEGVAPLMYHALNAAGWPEAMAAQVRHELQAAYYATAAHNTLIYQELARILHAIDNSQFTIHNSQLKIPVVVLKGAALATTIYPDPALRPLSDIDLLLPRQHLEAAMQAVQSLGYREAPPFPDMAPWLDWQTYRAHHVRMRGGPQGNLDVDLHWRLVAGDHDWRSPPLDWFWEQTEAWKMESGEWKGENGKWKMEEGQEGMESPLLW